MSSITIFSASTLGWIYVCAFWTWCDSLFFLWVLTPFVVCIRWLGLTWLMMRASLKGGRQSICNRLQNGIIPSTQPIHTGPIMCTRTSTFSTRYGIVSSLSYFLSSFVIARILTWLWKFLHFKLEIWVFSADAYFGCASLKCRVGATLLTLLPFLCWQFRESKGFSTIKFRPHTGEVKEISLSWCHCFGIL